MIKLEVHVKKSVFGRSKHIKKERLHTTEKRIEKRNKVVNEKRNQLKNDLVKLIIDDKMEKGCYYKYNEGNM